MVNSRANRNFVESVCSCFYQQIQHSEQIIVGISVHRWCLIVTNNKREENKKLQRKRLQIIQLNCKNYIHIFQLLPHFYSWFSFNNLFFQLLIYYQKDNLLSISFRIIFIKHDTNDIQIFAFSFLFFFPFQYFFPITKNIMNVI